MKLRSVEYAGTVAQPGQAPPGDLPQVAFSGRSNVGKSSLINVLLQRTRSKIAHVSSRPGKTQALNYYRVNDRFFLVDLPGFGYAKVPAKLRNAWRTLIESYLSSEKRLQGVVHLVDARRGVQPSDVDMIEYLSSLEVPALIVLTKVDKLKKSEREPVVEKAVAKLGVDAEQVLLFSSHTGEGRDDLLEALAGLLEIED
jgi:GTP-binding protein